VQWQPQLHAGAPLYYTDGEAVHSHEENDSSFDASEDEWGSDGGGANNINAHPAGYLVSDEMTVPGLSLTSRPNPFFVGASPGSREGSSRREKKDMQALNEWAVKIAARMAPKSFLVKGSGLGGGRAAPKTPSRMTPLSTPGAHSSARPRRLLEDIAAPTTASKARTLSREREIVEKEMEAERIKAIAYGERLYMQNAASMNPGAGKPRMPALSRESQRNRGATSSQQMPSRYARDEMYYNHVPQRTRVEAKGFAERTHGGHYDSYVVDSPVKYAWQEPPPGRLRKKADPVNEYIKYKNAWNRNSFLGRTKDVWDTGFVATSRKNLKRSGEITSR
jgi:hypothetical protein